MTPDSSTMGARDRSREPTSSREMERLWLGDRLKFRLPGFTRVSWVSESARQTWEPRIGSIQVAWRHLEWRSVADGFRECAWLPVIDGIALPPDPPWLCHGLEAASWQSGCDAAAAGGRVELHGRRNTPHIRIAVGRTGAAQELKELWESRRYADAGRLLGYPDCCIRSWLRLKAGLRCVDTIWPTALATQGARRVDQWQLAVGGPHQTNLLWRQLGLRLIPHLPCRLDCQASEHLGTRFSALGLRHGYRSEMLWLREMLSWPVQWSALHGIAELKTPILKFSTHTDATGSRYSVDWMGDDRTSHPSSGVSNHD